MNSLGSECNELKKQYDACFNAWFSGRFLHGDSDDSVCSSLFKVYQECVKDRRPCKNTKSNSEKLKENTQTVISKLPTRLPADQNYHPENQWPKHLPVDAGLVVFKIQLDVYFLLQHPQLRV